MGVDFTDSHWRGPICRCVPHNPFVTASPCHLPLHKGGFSACYKSKPPRGLYPSRRFLSKNLVLRNCCLQLRQTTVIIFLENKNAAACGCANTHKPAQVLTHLHNGPRPHHMGYYTREPPFLQGEVLMFRAFALPWGVLSRMRCVGVYPAQRFCFHPASGGSFSFYLSSDRRGENTRKEKRGRILETGCALSSDGAQKQYQESYTGEFEIWKVKSDPIRPGWLL